MRRRKAVAVAVKDERHAAYDAWHESRPKIPEASRPKYQEPEGEIVFFLFMLLAIIGFIAGFMLFIFGAADPSGVTSVVGFLGIFGFPVAAFVLMFVVAFIEDSIKVARYHRQMRRSGWAEYDHELKRWQLIGDEDFRDLAKTDYLVNMQMAHSVYGGSPPPIVKSDGESRPSSTRRVVTDDPELDALEEMLDNATPGVRHGIKLASAGSFRRAAKRLARQKQSDRAAGKRFIAQARFAATRPLSANSAGWYSSTSITPEETAAVIAEVSPYFSAAGLNVTRCWLDWRGMSQGAGGSFESLEVVVRVA